jgi:hypothetical protein
MADHRIRLTDRELELASTAAQSMVWALLPRYPDLAHDYGDLVSRLAHTKAGGQPAAVRAARKHFKTEAPIA